MMREQIFNKLKWPYPIKWDLEQEINTDILVLGGGIAGCWAAISAAKKGAKVSCVDECPKPGAIKLNPLPMNRIHWKRKTGSDMQ